MGKLEEELQLMAAIKQKSDVFDLWFCVKLFVKLKELIRTDRAFKDRVKEVEEVPFGGFLSDFAKEICKCLVRQAELVDPLWGQKFKEYDFTDTVTPDGLDTFKKKVKDFIRGRELEYLKAIGRAGQRKWVEFRSHFRKKK